MGAAALQQLQPVFRFIFCVVAVGVLGVQLLLIMGPFPTAGTGV